MCGDDLDDVECGTIHASGSIPIQIDYYYFEFKVLEMKPNCDIIIGKLIFKLNTLTLESVREYLLTGSSSERNFIVPFRMSNGRP